MKILITSIVDLKKCAHTRLHEFVRYLGRSHEISVLCINDWWKAGQTDTSLYMQGLEDTLNGTRVEYFTERKMSPMIQELSSAFTISRCLEKLEYRNFDIHFNYSSLISGYFVARKLKQAGIITVYDLADDLPEMVGSSTQLPPPVRPAAKVLGNVMLRRNLAIAGRTVYVDDNLKRKYPVPLDRACVIRNGVDTELFSPRESGPLREKLGLGGDFVLGFVGTMREWVDFGPLFQALGGLKDDYPDIKVLIVGEEGGLEPTRESARRCGILDRLVFAGTVPYKLVPHYIACMDACLIPFARSKGMDSGEDGFCPLKLAEYLACEKPVISTHKTVVPGGIVSYASEPEEYRECISRLYTNSDARKEMGVRGRDFIQRSHTWANSSRELERVLLEAAG